MLGCESSQAIDPQGCADGSVHSTRCACPYSFGQWLRVHCQAVRLFLSRLSVKPLFIELGSPWENGYIESFNGKMRDELLAREIFYSLKEAQVMIEMWTKHYNTVRPHSSLGYRPPVPATFILRPSQISRVGLT